MIKFQWKKITFNNEDCELFCCYKESCWGREKWLGHNNKSKSSHMWSIHEEIKVLSLSVICFLVSVCLKHQGIGTCIWICNFCLYLCMHYIHCRWFEMAVTCGVLDNRVTRLEFEVDFFVVVFLNATHKIHRGKRVIQAPSLEQK